MHGELYQQEGHLRVVPVLSPAGYEYLQQLLVHMGLVVVGFPLGANKTSVKAMEAREIEADVTRVYPVRTDSPEIISYYEYCDFCKETGLYAIFFSRPGSYQKLLSLPGIRSGDHWTEDDILSLRKLFRCNKCIDGRHKWNAV